MFILHFLPKNLISFVTGAFVRLRIPFLSPWMMRLFAGHYKINMDEAELSMAEYKCIGDLFVRKLKSGVRPLAEAEIVHPSDSKITEHGLIKDGQLIQTKGKTYSLTEFIGDKNAINDYEGGYFITYYLCPTDYHRVHSPVSGEITSCKYIPGRLWPVNPWSVENISQLFSVNERVAINIKTPKGKVCAVMVGATNVGRMTTAFDPNILTNAKHFRSEELYSYSPAKPIKKGDELGAFHMGSTVIVLFDKSYGMLNVSEGVTKVREALGVVY